jgi:hypothetical protein
MSTSPPKFRHTIEHSKELVRITLPSKKSIFRFLFVFLWFLLWGYMVYAFVVIAAAFNKSIEVGKSSIPPVQPGGTFFYFSVCFSLFFIILLAMGAFAVWHVGWLFAGKEVIEATPQKLTITKQTFRWGKVREYSTENVSPLRLNTRQLSPFAIGKRIKRILAGAGMIAFDYDKRTFSFALDISEAEAMQIISVLKDAHTE